MKIKIKSNQKFKFEITYKNEVNAVTLNNSEKNLIVKKMNRTYIGNLIYKMKD